MWKYRFLLRGDLRDGTYSTCGCLNSELTYFYPLQENNIIQQYSFPRLKGDYNALLYFRCQRRKRHLIEYQGE